MSAPGRSGALLACALLVAPAARAERIELRLDEAIARARAYSARLEGLRSLETAASAGGRAARAARLPSLELSGAYVHFSKVAELTLVLPGLGERTLFPNIQDALRTRAALDLPLYTGGRVEGAIASAARLQDAAASDVATGEADLVLETTAAWWSLVTARESEHVLGEAAHGYEAHLRDAQNRMDLGMAARNELLEVQVARDRAELARLQSVNNQRVASATLVRLTGLPDESEIEPVLPDAPAPLATAERAALIEAALRARPELAALEARVLGLDASVRVARAAGRPQAALSAGYDYASPNPRILPLEAEWKGSWSAGVSVSLTAFDSGRAAAAAAEAQARADALRHQLEDARRGVRLEVTTRLLDLDTAEAAFVVAERSLEAAREDARVSRDRYLEGLLASSDLLDAETSLLRAGLERTLAGAERYLAAARLDRALGK